MERFLMSEVLKILEDLFSGAASSVKVLEVDPPGSLVYGTLVKHIEDPKTFGFVSESYRTDKKDINGKDVFYYNIIWEGLKSSNSKNSMGYYNSSLGQKYTSVEPEHDLICWHGNVLN